MKDFANRDEVVIATKVHGKMHDRPNGAGLPRKAILSEIDKSLKRLGTDYVDFYLIHRERSIRYELEVAFSRPELQRRSLRRRGP